jgi:hypothetical protein
VSGITEDGEFKRIPLSEIQYMWVKDTEEGTIVLYVLGGLLLVAGGLALIAALTSCPFVYSHDGDQYVLDSEPFGGAIAKPLERTDHDVLDNLAAVDGRYKLKVTNELAETQHLNSLQLLVLDHPADTRVLVDRYGAIHTLTEAVPLSAAREADGRDVLSPLQEKDGVFWKSNMLAKDPESEGDAREEIILEFPKPRDARSAKLVMNLCNSPWSMYMFKKYLGLLGDDRAEVLDDLDHEPGRVEMLKALIKQQGILHFEVAVWKRDEWVRQGYVTGASPVLTQERILALDLDGILAENLRVRLSMASGFWMIDDAFVDYSDNMEVSSTAITAEVAVDQNGRDVAGLLREDDDAYYKMPDVGNFALLEFAEPARRSGLTRSVALKARGYYEIHMDEEPGPDTVSLFELLSKPDGPGQYSLKTFHEIFSGSASAAN